MEILAPCGSPRHIQPAVYCGANAVYLGARALSARAGAENFTKEQLREAVSFCHRHGVKVYQTVNTLLRDDEMEALQTILHEAAQAGVDALIVQDLGVARIVRACLPGMDIHASTQTSVHTPDGVGFLEDLGFSRVVLARELSKRQIKDISAVARIGLEAFVHGALCVCVSGQCLLSAVLGGRSGNRGQCAQPCRLDFQSGNQSFALSLKDLSLIEKVHELKEAGVTSLKIEGRMKRPEYVAACVLAIRAALEGKQPDMQTLTAVFSRSGFTQGYFSGQMKHMRGIRTKDDVTAAQAVLPELEKLYKEPQCKQPLDISVAIRQNRQAELTVSMGRHSLMVLGDVPQTAVTKAVTREDIIRQISKLGGTRFTARSVTALIDPGLMLPLSALNGLRRQMLAGLDEAASVTHVVDCPAVLSVPSIAPLPRAPVTAPPLFRVECRGVPQWLAVRGHVWQGVLPLGEVLRNERLLLPDADKLLIALPRLQLGTEGDNAQALRILYAKGFRHLLCQNASHILTGDRAGFALHGGWGLNVANSHTALTLSEQGLMDLTLSPELKLSQKVTCVRPLGRVVYGRLPLMLLARCPHTDGPATGGRCPDCRPLTDRLGKRFPMRCEGSGMEVLNADVLWMADRLGQLNGLTFVTFLLDREDSPSGIIEDYRKGAIPSQGFTRGLYYRGVV